MLLLLRFNSQSDLMMAARTYSHLSDCGFGDNVIPEPGWPIY
jgi:hypothetical protein